MRGECARKEERLRTFKVHSATNEKWEHGYFAQMATVLTLETGKWTLRVVTGTWGHTSFLF